MPSAKRLVPASAIMTDANGKLTLPEAIRLGRRLAEFDVVWFEEPTTFDDVLAHRRLAESIETPIALGEQPLLGASTSAISSFTPGRFTSCSPMSFDSPASYRVAASRRSCPQLHPARRPARRRHVPSASTPSALAHAGCRLLEQIPRLPRPPDAASRADSRRPHRRSRSSRAPAWSRPRDARLR